MKPLSASEIRGNWATLNTPWSADESLDLPRLAAEIDAMLGFGVDGIYSNGTAGEFHCQTEEEFDLMAHIGGWADIGARMRWPYRSIPASEIPRLRSIVDQLLPEFSS